MLLLRGGSNLGIRLTGGFEPSTFGSKGFMLRVSRAFFEATHPEDVIAQFGEIKFAVLAADAMQVAPKHYGTFLISLGFIIKS